MVLMMEEKVHEASSEWVNYSTQNYCFIFSATKKLNSLEIFVTFAVVLCVLKNFSPEGRRD